MSTPEYLYGFGRLRHIQDPDYARGTPFCDHSPPPWHKGWSTLDRTDPEVLMAANKALPVCWRCEKAWDRRQRQVS